MNIDFKLFQCSMFKFTLVLWRESVLVFSCQQRLDIHCAHNMGQGWRETEREKS